MPRELREKIERELEPGESLRWTGRPVARYFSPASVGLFLFGIPWTAFALFWTGTAAWGASHGPGLFSLFPLFGLPFILVGIGLLTSPIWTRKKAMGTAYAITDRRALAIEKGWSTTVVSYPPERLDALARRERSNGLGDIIISRRAWRDSEGHGHSVETGFLNIQNPKEVETMLRELAQRARPAGR